MRDSLIMLAMLIGPVLIMLGVVLALIAWAVTRGGEGGN